MIQRDATDPAEGKQGYPGGDFGKGGIADQKRHDIAFC